MVQYIIKRNSIEKWESMGPHISFLSSFPLQIKKFFLHNVTTLVYNSHDESMSPSHTHIRRTSRRGSLTTPFSVFRRLLSHEVSRVRWSRDGRR